MECCDSTPHAPPSCTSGVAIPGKEGLAPLPITSIVHYHDAVVSGSAAGAVGGGNFLANVVGYYAGIDGLICGD